MRVRPTQHQVTMLRRMRTINDCTETLFNFPDNDNNNSPTPLTINNDVNDTTEYLLMIKSLENTSILRVINLTTVIN